MSISSIQNTLWTGDRQEVGAVSKESESDQVAFKSSISDFAFGIGTDQISVSTIVEKLVMERLKLGIVKAAKGADQIIRDSVTTIDLGGESEDSSQDTIPSLSVCLDKFESRTVKIHEETAAEGSEPEENPPNVIEPDFSEPEEAADAEYRDPNKDIQMMLNRTRSFYTPSGFKDSRFDLKRLENEREKMWMPVARDKYTIFLYEEALKPLKHLRIKGKIYEDDEVDAFLSRDDVVNKSLESLMAFIKPKELPPEEWDPENLAGDKNAPYWAFAPAHATDKTINKIRYIHKILRETDFQRQDPKLRRRTGRKMYRQAVEDVEESDESAQRSSGEESSEDEPYLLKRKESAFIKKKVVLVEEEEDDEQAVVIRPGIHNIQVGHEISISTIQKEYPESVESDEAKSEKDVKMAPTVTPTPERLKSKATRTKTATPRKPVRGWGLKKDELDDLTSEESLYDIGRALETEQRQSKADLNKPFISMHRGFPVIRQRPKWITLQRECLEKEGEDNSLVERYRCLCLNRGIPPLEAVARNIKRRSAIFNRLGRGPESSIQTMTEVLGKQTKTLDLTGFYMTNNDICHLGKALPKFLHLEKLRLPRTQLNGEKLLYLTQRISQCKQICLLDVSYNGIRKITPAITKSLKPVQTLCSLNLSHCQLANDSFAGLAHLPGTLKSLDISWNKLNEASGLRTLSTSLVKHQSQLRELRISWNSLSGIDTAKILSEIAKTLKNLNMLDISYNCYKTSDEMTCFKSMLMESPKLRCFLLAGNPLGEITAAALLTDLNWDSKPSLKLLDLGDVWIDKETYQIVKMLKSQYDVETRIGGIKGNINLMELDMREPFIKRLYFLNYSKKKKKPLKDLGNAVLKLMEQEGAMKVKSGKFKQFIIDEKFKLEEGLVEALTKSLADKQRMIDLSEVHSKYRALYPEEIKEPKKKKPKKKMRAEEIPIIELMEPKPEMAKSKTNILFVKATTPVSGINY